MATPVEMPRLGNTVEECLLVAWRKRAGEPVAEGEVIAEIETDKASFEIAAPVAGTLLERFAAEGDLVPVLTNICVIGEAGEAVDGFRPVPAAGVGQAVSPALSAGQPEAPAPPAASQSLSPRARRFAREHGLDPGGIAGSGPAGRVLESDLQRLYHAAPRVSSLARELIRGGWELEGPGSGLGGMILARDLGAPAEPLSGLRERIARRMRESLATTAQYTLHGSADAAALLALRRKIKENPELAHITIHDMVLFCAVRAVREMPEVNAELVEGRLRRHASIHLAFACDTPRGLLAPVIRDAGKLSLVELARRARALAGQAAAGSISPDDLVGGTFTVSNLGALGVESFTPILNPPQVAILGVDAITVRPVRRGDKIEFVDSIGLSLTCDHQVIDGAPGARFLAVVKRHIESFTGDGECTI
jgi:pyruvate dehydrogenase E2 component (dihydrolipoamide acetyltransferase)